MYDIIAEYRELSIRRAINVNGMECLCHSNARIFDVLRSTLLVEVWATDGGASLCDYFSTNRKKKQHHILKNDVSMSRSASRISFQTTSKAQS